MKFDGIEAFLAIVESGSISEAARRLGLAKSVVSERLAELEHSLGARLIQRTTRKLSLTEDGHRFMVRAQRIVHEASEAKSEMSERRGTLIGPMRISAPVGFGALHLGPAIGQFLEKHPKIELSLELDDRFVDAAAGGFDAVLRHSPVSDNRLVAKRLATSRRLMLASPSYLRRNGTPTSIEALSDHHGILYANRDADWRFTRDGVWTVIRPHCALRVNNGLVMRDAALAGLGLTLLPTFFVHAELKARTLRPVDLDADAEGAELHIAYPRDRSTSAKVIALTEFLRATFGTPPYWDR